MGLFHRKKKENPKELKKLISTIGEKGIAYFKCPYCNTTLRQGYYLTIKVDDIVECPYCGEEIGH